MIHTSIIQNLIEFSINIMAFIMMFVSYLERKRSLCQCDNCYTVNIYKYIYIELYNTSIQI